MNTIQECCLSFYETSLMVTHEGHINSYRKDSLRNPSSKSLGQRWSSMQLSIYFPACFPNWALCQELHTARCRRAIGFGKQKVSLLSPIPCLKGKEDRNIATLVWNMSPMDLSPGPTLSQHWTVLWFDGSLETIISIHHLVGCPVRFSNNKMLSFINQQLLNWMQRHFPQIII